MINQDSVLAAFPLASQLAEKGIVIGPRENSQLSQLVQVTNTEFINSNGYFTPDGDLEVKSFASVLEDVTHGTLDAPSTHDMTLDRSVDQTANAVKRHIAFARNVVKPVIMEFREKLELRVKAAALASPADDFNIKVVQVPEIFQDAVFRREIDRWTNRPLRPDSFINFPSKSVDEINALMMTGDKDEDEATVTWQSRLGPDFSLKIWHSFFCTEALEGVNQGTQFTLDQLETMPAFCRMDIFLAIYLLANKLYDQVEGAEGLAVNLAAYQNLVAQLRDYASASLHFILTEIDRMLRLKFLVARIDRDKNEIEVLKPIYDEWLDNGGKPEILLGLLVSNKELRMATQIDAEAVELEKQWNSQCAYFNNIRQNKLYISTKEAIESTFYEMLNDVNEEEQAARKYLANYEARVEEKLKAIIADMRTPDLEDLNEISLSVIGKVRFYYCAAEQILRDIEEVTKANPKIDVREAAYLAAFSYITRFVADQLVKVPG